MIRKLILSLALLALFAGEAAAQYAPDSTQIAKANLEKGLSLKNTGTGMLVGGGATALLGGGILGLTFLSVHNKTGEGAGIIAALGLSISGSLVLAGSLTAIAGIPFIASGNAILNCNDGYWKQAQFADERQRGFSLIIEGGALFGLPPGIQLRTVAGYNFNQHIFLGGGIAPGYATGGSYAEGCIPFTLPVFADFRYSFGNKMFSPYLGAGAGLEVFNESWPPYPSIYLSVEGGLRMRMSAGNPNSFWVSALGETSAGVVRAGIKMGCSF